MMGAAECPPNRPGRMALEPDSAPHGKLPPYEVAKAIAFDDVITQMEKDTGKFCRELLGDGKKKFVAKRLEWGVDIPQLAQ